MSTTADPSPRITALAESPQLAARAAELLRTPAALMQLGADDAACVAANMLLIQYPAHAVVMQEGDALRSNYLLLLLEGEVSVETAGSKHRDEHGHGVPIGVLSAGSIIGEMALLDGAPRSATVIAASAVQAAGLSRKGLARLIDEHPQAAARLLVGLASRISDRLRALSDQLQMLAQINAAQQDELEQLRSR